MMSLYRYAELNNMCGIFTELINLLLISKTLHFRLHIQALKSCYPIPNAAAFNLAVPCKHRRRVDSS
ncbi:hypothetical protein XELAEV_18044278mg [Xenopus laevis]|uniref:Uncharacterized protein n=1 Tax=Xenopus laevis TaxID=8355 RepID=A0A974BZ78_XENLA|nr:hypothetical protein XELAEV_18044278mg [Xenopus laevis]